MLKEQLKDRVLTLLVRTDRDKTYTALWIAKCLGSNERTVRDAIKELRDEGHNIISHPSFKGYYLGSIEDVKIVANHYRSRAFEMLATAHKMEHKDPAELELFRKRLEV